MRVNINLLGYQHKRVSTGPQIDKALLVMILLIIIPIILSVGSMTILNNMKKEQEDKKADLKQKIAVLEKQLKELNNIEKKRDTLRKEKAILEYVTEKNYKWSTLLEELRNVIPINLWITNISIDGAFGFSVNGKTFDHKTVSLFVTNLLHSPFFHSASIVSTSRSGRVVSFVISGKIRGSGK